MKIVIPGGSGQVGTLLARALHADGHEVVVLSRKPIPAKWLVLPWDARTLGDWMQTLDGADAVVNAKTSSTPAADVKKATDGGAHGVLITAASLPAFKQGIEMTRKRGTCVLVGLPPGDFPVPLFDVVANCITIRGSFVGTRRDMAEALAFAAEGKVKADIELAPLATINETFRRLEHGEVASRVVLDFTRR